MGVGFGIWEWISLLWAMAPVRALIEGNFGWFGVGFGLGRSHSRLRGFGGSFSFWVIL